MHALTSALPKQLSDWYEGRSALRMLIAALGAYVCTKLIHLAGHYTAVITTLIVARPHSGGVLRASFERLVTTLLGAGLACGITFGRLKLLEQESYWRAPALNGNGQQKRSRLLPACPMLTPLSKWNVAIANRRSRSSSISRMVSVNLRPSC